MTRTHRSVLPLWWSNPYFLHSLLGLISKFALVCTRLEKTLSEKLDLISLSANLYKFYDMYVLGHGGHDL